MTMQEQIKTMLPHLTEDELATVLAILRHGTEVTITPPSKTRYDAIREMSLPEMAAFFEHLEDEGSTWTADFAEVHCHECQAPEGSCSRCEHGSATAWWLSQPFENAF